MLHHYKTTQQYTKQSYNVQNNDITLQNDLTKYKTTL